MKDDQKPFWKQVPLAEMSDAQWESLCDGCGKCCLNKLEDTDTGGVFHTRVACHLFDDASCRCRDYAHRQEIVPDCIRLTPATIALHSHWLPDTCAYKLLYEGATLPAWHPLCTQDPQSVHEAGASVQGKTVSEHAVPQSEWEDYPLS